MTSEQVQALAKQITGEVRLFTARAIADNVGPLHARIARLESDVRTLESLLAEFECGERNTSAAAALRAVK